MTVTPTTPLTLADADGHTVLVRFHHSPRTLTGQVVVDDDLDLILHLRSGTVAVVAAVYAAEVVVEPDSPDPSDATDLLVEERNCAACGDDGSGRALQRSRAIALTGDGRGFGLCATHLRQHGQALADRNVTVVHTVS